MRPTSGSDAKSEHAYHRRGSWLHDSSGSTIVIAHQLATIRNAAGIAVMKDGMKVEQGEHDELIDGQWRQGHIRSTLDAQFVEKMTRWKRCRTSYDNMMAWKMSTWWVSWGWQRGEPFVCISATSLLCFILKKNPYGPTFYESSAIPFLWGIMSFFLS